MSSFFQKRLGFQIDASFYEHLTNQNVTRAARHGFAGREVEPRLETI